MTKKINIFNFKKQPRDFNDQTFEVNLIEDSTNEHFELESENESEVENSNTKHDPRI